MKGRVTEHSKCMHVCMWARRPYELVCGRCCMQIIACSWLLIPLHQARTVSVRSRQANVTQTHILSEGARCKVAVAPLSPTIISVGCACTHSAETTACMMKVDFTDSQLESFLRSSRDYTRGSMVSSASSVHRARPRAKRADVVCVASCTKASPTFLDGPVGN